MAEEKKLEAVEEAPKAPAKKKAVAKKDAAPKEKTAKATAKKEEAKVEEKKVSFAKPTAHDFEVIVAPMITEKSMAMMQNQNKVTVKVLASANKIEIKDAFQRIFQVPVVGITVSNKAAKETSRGGRYKGTISGFKKAIVTVAEGNAIDLFKE